MRRFSALSPWGNDPPHRACGPGLLVALAALAAVALPFPAAAIVPTLDYGDAPSPFPTLANQNGARHTVVTGVHLGQRVDTETDGQPNPTATGDDVNPPGAPSDEDGVTFLTQLIPGQSATVQVVASISGRLDAWMDFNANGSWADAGDQIATNLSLSAGANTLTVSVPCSAKAGPVFARFRFSRQGGLSFFGAWTDGEVEDYRVTIANAGPQISCPPNQTVLATGPDGAQVTYAVSATDPCNANVVINCDPPSGSTFPIGTHSVTCTAMSGGQSATCRFTVTVLEPRCCDEKEWREFALRLSPGPRQGHAMAFDTARGRAVLFGGEFDGLRGDTWEWNGAGWASVATSGPPPRRFTAMAYDVARRVTVLFGGLSANGAQEDTWEWNGIQWRRIDFAGPPPRHGHAMAYDRARRVTVLFGGTSPENQDLNDTWEYDGTKWVPAPTGIPAPPPRARHVMAYHGSTGQTVLFGGFSKAMPLGDTWGWDGKGWTRLTDAGPSARGGAAMAEDTACDRLALFGGGTSVTNLFGDTWEWDGAVWKPAATTGPGSRAFPAMCYDNVRAQTLMYGGFGMDPTGQPGTLGDFWAWVPDQTPPRLVSVYVTCGDNKIILAFDEPILPASAQDPANYEVFCGPVVVPVTNVVVVEDSRLVCLFTEQPIGGAAAACSLVVQNIQDLCGNTLEMFQFSLACTPDPCPRGSAGTEFWLTFPGNYAPDPLNPPRPRLFIAGDPGTIGSVSLPGLTPPFAANFTIPAGRVATVVLPRAADLGDANDVIESKGVHVLASRKVSVYGHHHVRYTTDSYLGLALSALGRAYMVATYQNVFTAVPELNGVQFAIVGTEDDTKVVIVPPVTVGAHPAGVPYPIALNKGQTYQLRHTNDLPADLTGTIIVADRPIAVFGSHQCANIPNDLVFFCDYLVEQMLPVETWGNNFVTVPLRTRTRGDTFRFLALFNGTTVRTNGVPIPGLLNQGRFHEVRLATRAHITSDKPILVAQYANSSDYDLVENSDPFMVLIPPTHQFAASYVVQTPTTGFPDNYLNVVAPAAAVGQVSLDGVAIPAAMFQPIGASGYSGAQVPVSPGPHTLFSSSGATFGVIAYGWAQYDSYGYPAGQCAVREVQPPQFGCPPRDVVGQLGADCRAQVPDLRGQVGNGSAAVLITQDPLPGTPVGPGTYTIVVTIVNQLGDQQICRSTLTVPPSSAPGLRCPTDILTSCTSRAGRVVFYEVGLCNTNFAVTCDPPSGSLFPPGTTVVTCTAGGAAGATETCSFRVTVDCPQLTITAAPGTVTVSWEGTGTLLKATSVAGPWTPVFNARSPFTLNVTNRQEFFRLVR